MCEKDKPSNCDRPETFFPLNDELIRALRSYYTLHFLGAQSSRCTVSSTSRAIGAVTHQLRCRILPMPNLILANITWLALSSSQAAFAVGTATARRYVYGFPPVVGFANPSQPDFAGLERFCEVGENLYCGAWSGKVPGGWDLAADTFAHQMVWRGKSPKNSSAMRVSRLGPGNLKEMHELILVTQPGPFCDRSLDLGDFYGVFVDGRLAAMVGERFQAGPLREISSVCTHPDFEGRGFARHLIERLVREQIERGQTPFLHVMDGNDRARFIYERMGFRKESELPVRVIFRV